MKRSECVNGPRPCLLFSCSYNMSFDAADLDKPESLNSFELPTRLPIRVLTPVGPDGEAMESVPVLREGVTNCALDFHDDPQDNVAIAKALGIAPQDVDAIVAQAMRKLIHHSHGLELLEVRALLRQLRRLAL